MMVWWVKVGMVDHRRRVGRGTSHVSGTSPFGITTGQNSSIIRSGRLHHEHAACAAAAQPRRDNLIKGATAGLWGGSRKTGIPDRRKAARAIRGK